MILISKAKTRIRMLVIIYFLNLQFIQGLDETARSLADAATKEHARRGISGAVGGILREMPSTLLFRPVIVATAATTNMLEGVKNQVTL